MALSEREKDQIAGLKNQIENRQRQLKQYTNQKKIITESASRSLSLLKTADQKRRHRELKVQKIESINRSMELIRKEIQHRKDWIARIKRSSVL